MYALCDVNSMYASCEKVFDPSIRNKPVVVLTNNDGCVCAACDIAKARGVGKKFVPYFQVKKELEKAGAVIRSSNYELYAELSQRMMDTCAQFAPDIHIYSIDECFLFYGQNATTPSEEWLELAKSIKEAVWQHVRLPIGVGFGATPTLAKAANHAAKKIEGFHGVAVINDEPSRKYILSNMALTDIWGIGSRLAKRLRFMGVKTALDLASLNPIQVRKEFSILVESTVRELNGEIRHNWDDVRAPKKEIYSTRSFGQRITCQQQLKLAFATHAEIVATKLRKQKSLTHRIIVFASNSPHDKEAYYKQSVLIPLAVPTNDTSNIIKATQLALPKIYRQGVNFYRCGVGLVELQRESEFQYDLFNASTDNKELMNCMDNINAKYGRGTVHLAAKGIEQKFAMRRAFLSPQYTTRWRDIPKISCR